MGTSLETESIVGPMGSEFYRIKVPAIMREAINWDYDWNKLGKRVMIDAKAGIISWMSPASNHEDMGYDTEEIVRYASALLKKVIRGKRGTRWRRPDGSVNIGVEPDASFYIGENARNYYMICRNGTEDEIDHFVGATPPDLVAEVEVTNFDAGKPGIYKEIGVREMWQAKYRQGQKVEVTILDLQAEGGPYSIAQSMVLPGLKAATLPQAYGYARQGRFNDLQTLLKKDLITPSPTKPSPPSPKPGM